MVRSKYSLSLLILPLSFAIAWGRATYSYISYDWIYILPSLALFCLIGYFLLWSQRLRRFLLKNESLEMYLKYFVDCKIKLSALILLSFTLLAELSPLIYYPIYCAFGMFFSILAFMKYKGRDAIAIKNLLLNSESSKKDEVCFQILSGGYIKKIAHANSVNVDGNKLCKVQSFNSSYVKDLYPVDCSANMRKHSSAPDMVGRDNIMDDSSYSLAGVNPSTGLYMTGGSLDSGGNHFGNPEKMD